MHTVHLLTVSPSMHCAAGCLLPGGVSAPGGGEGCLLLGGGCLLLGGGLLLGVSASIGGVCSWGGGVPACTEADPP